VQAKKIAMPKDTIRQVQFPLPVVSHAAEGIGRIRLPPAKITQQINGIGVGRPFPEHPSARRPVQPEVFMTRGQMVQIGMGPQYPFTRSPDVRQPPNQCLAVTAQVRVGINQSIGKTSVSVHIGHLLVISFSTLRKGRHPAIIIIERLVPASV
jgi:hypothetical protein